MLLSALSLAALQVPVAQVQLPASPRVWGLRVNFQSELAPVPPGYLRDFGESFGPRTGADQGSNLRFGWSEQGSGVPLDMTARGRDRDAVNDQRLDTFMHMELQGGAMATWEIALPNGDYSVRVTCGDPSFFDSRHRVVVEGLVALDGYEPTSAAPHVTVEATARVADGRLTIDSIGGDNTKLNWIEILRGGRAEPQVNGVTPVDGTVDVPLDTFIATDVYLPRGGLDPSTVTAQTVKLYAAATPGSPLQAVVNTTGGGDAIVLDPVGDLEPQTDYVFEITDDVRDVTGDRFVPFTSTFRTVSNTNGQIVDLEFERETVATAAQYTSLEIGPDGKLYALQFDGAIHRFDIEPDGTLSGMEAIFSLVTAEGGARLAIGLTHDPASTAAAPIVWVSHSTFGFQNMPDWGGKLSRLSGPSLEVVEAVVEELPRSARDHLTNSLAFGPDGALYFCQGGNNAMGAPDTTWANRPERKLSAAVLRLDTAALGVLPLNVRTAEGGTYDPFAPGAPLTVYASGLRNGYDLVFHSNGSLYVPGNASASGGNAPSSPDPLPPSCGARLDGPYLGPAVPGIAGVNQTLDDVLMRVEPGGYYGHPNPSRCEWVLAGGNPTEFADPFEVSQYPVGTMPDPNFRGYVFDFQNNRSPNGVIEYRSERFGGSLQSTLIVARYSGGDDLMVLRPSADGSIGAGLAGIATFDGFNDPLDVTEDVATGNLYVSEYGSGVLTVLRPVDGTVTGVDVAVEAEVSSAIQGTTAAAGLIEVTNSSAAPLRVESIELVGEDPAAFLLLGVPALPLDLASGAVLTFDAAFAPAAGEIGSLGAVLRITTDRGVSTAGLFGLSAATLGGGGEPPLARIVESLGVSIDVGSDQLSLGVDPEPLGDEVAAPLFVKAGPGPVTMTPVARYSPDGPLPFGHYLPNGPAPAMTVLGAVSGDAAAEQHQTLFPELVNGGVTFDPGQDLFGLFVSVPSHDIFTEDGLNTLLFPGFAAHGVRVYPYVDRRGFVDPDAFVVGFEEATNGDYQDYVFVIRNARPVQ